MRRRIAVYGASDAALALLPALAGRRDLELAWIYDPRARALRRRLAWIEPGAARLLQQALTDDPSVPASAGDVALVIDGGLAPPAAAPPTGAVPPAAASALLGLPPAPWREPVALDRPGSAARPPARPPAPPAAPAAPVAEPAPPSAPDGLTRALAGGRRFALLRCAAGPGADGAPPAPALAARVLRRAEASLRRALGPGGLLDPSGDGALLAVVPLAPDADPAAPLLRLARSAAEDVAEELGDAPLRAPLVFGYALHPDEARSTESLLARARRTRIRML